MDIPQSQVSVAAVSVPACCQISQVPPTRTTKRATLQRAARNPLPVDEAAAVSVSFISLSFVSHRVVLSPPVNRQSLLSVFLI